MNQKERKAVIKRLDDMCRTIVKITALKTVGGCERCLARKDSISELDWAHNQPRQRLSTRWDIRNAAGLCSGCHRYLDNNHDEKREFFEKRLGKGVYELVRILSQTTQKVDYDLVYLDLKQKTELLNGP